MAAQHSKPKSNISVKDRISLRSCKKRIKRAKIKYLHELSLPYPECSHLNLNIMFENRFNMTQNYIQVHSFKT